jgi:hypothetical protein
MGYLPSEAAFGVNNILGATKTGISTGTHGKECQCITSSRTVFSAISTTHRTTEKQFMKPRSCSRASCIACTIDHGSIQTSRQSAKRQHPSIQCTTPKA